MPAPVLAGRANRDRKGSDQRIPARVAKSRADVTALQAMRREQVVSRGIDGLDLNSYPPYLPLSCRADWRPTAGKPGTEIGELRRVI